jgi:phage anti-repressor protein
MNSTDLVPVFTGELNGESVQLVNARDLHDFLGVARDFSNWIKKRLKDGGFVLNRDYLLTKMGEQVPANFDSPNLANQNQRGGDRRSVDYHLPLETAKHIGMMERNEKGHQIRAYFIECERRAQTHVSNLFTDELQSAINQEAHTLALRSFGPIRARIVQLVRYCLDGGESQAEVLGRVRRGVPLAGDMVLIPAGDLWQLTTAVAGLANALHGPMDAVHKLEATTGRLWYSR